MGSMTYWTAALITDMTGLSWGGQWSVRVVGTGNVSVSVVSVLCVRRVLGAGAA